MNQHLLTVQDDGSAPALPEVTAALSRLLAAEVRVLARGSTAAEVTVELARPEVAACVLPARAPSGAVSSPLRQLCWQVVQHADKPVVLVSPQARLAHPVIRRVLLPLDGSAEAALAVSETARLLHDAGVELVALHVFDATTTPGFWDQRAHAADAWMHEFLSRCEIPPGSRLELRSGTPAEHVVRTVEAEDVDLVALGWSRDIRPGRARTVRAAVASARAPVLLMPVHGLRPADPVRDVSGDARPELADGARR
jgi:nucleotide-binding universal stress UspA family protein